jgi:hypothetical protein
MKNSNDTIWNRTSDLPIYVTWCFGQITVQIKIVCCVAVIQEPTRPQKCVSPVGVICISFLIPLTKQNCTDINWCLSQNDDNCTNIVKLFYLVCVRNAVHDRRHSTKNMHADSNCIFLILVQNLSVSHATEILSYAAALKIHHLGFS